MILEFSIDLLSYIFVALNAVIKVDIVIPPMNIKTQKDPIIAWYFVSSSKYALIEVKNIIRRIKLKIAINTNEIQ